MSEADDRIFDMLLGGDGEAFFQAERYLKANRPDLYEKLGQASGATLVDNLIEAAKEAAVGRQNGFVRLDLQMAKAALLDYIKKLEGGK